jgi:hypothetical protein
MPVMTLHAILHIHHFMHFTAFPDELVFLINGPTIMSYIWQLNGSPAYRKNI